MINYMVQRITKLFGILALTGLSGLIDAQTMDWSPAGPIYTAGRSRNMIVDKSDPSGNTMYVGSTSSGVFKTTDGGSNWAPLNDQGSVRNISYIAQAADNTIYVATGEGFLRAGQKLKAQVGTGLYKLSGTSLVPVATGTDVGTVITRIACDPSSYNHIALATNKGVMVSTNITSGATFALAPGIPTSSLITGQDVKFDGSGILYCSVGSETGVSYASGNTLNVPSKVYKATDANMANPFAEITPTSSVLADANYGRIELAIAPSNNNVVYVSCANKNTTNSITAFPASASLKALFVSYNASTTNSPTWGLVLQGSPQIDPLSNGGTIASGDYAHVILVNPTNPDQLFYGGYKFYIFTRTGGSNSSPIGNWVSVGESFVPNVQLYLHENIHDIKIVAGSPTKFYFVTDAGIYRSSDMVNTNTLPSFQPFYKGLVTGQFNSVSIDRYPATVNTSTTNGSKVTPISGFIGGTGGNGFTYFSGTASQVTQETNYLSGEVYNTEYSKILNGAAMLSTGNGGFYRTANAKSSLPTLANLNTYSGGLSKLAPSPNGFGNSSYNTGTPFKLWENYGQRANTPDYAIFYNDTVRFQSSFSGIPELITKTTFTFAAARPNAYALIDSISIRTGTVVLPITTGSASPAFITGQDIRIKLSDNYVNTSSLTVLTGSNITRITGPLSTAIPASVTLNNSNLLDNISVTFTAAPFADKTATSTTIDNSAYYRVFATVYYRYKAGDVVTAVDNNISTKTYSYSTVLTTPLKWKYSSGIPSYAINASTATAVSNPTYVLNPGNITSSTGSFNVMPITQTNYTISHLGTYSLTAKPVTYTLTIPTNTNLAGSTYTLNINPGAITTTIASTQLVTSFTVAPDASTNYTMTQTGTSTFVTSFSTISTSYQLDPGAVTNSISLFLVTNTGATTYTLQGISSNTLLGASTSVTNASLPARTFSTVGSTSIPTNTLNNPIVRMKTVVSARLAFMLNNTGNTGSGYAIMVSKNPLALNDPLDVVRISQSGCFMDDNTGAPSNTVIGIAGKPTILEWSKNGTELYYATDNNKVYRVSHITDIFDLSPSSYAGKFYTDIFKYGASAIGSSLTPNPVSPYRTTLIGSFDRVITSISVSKDDKNLLISFNPTGTGTTGVVMYNANDARVSDVSNISWADKSGSIASGIGATYCSLMEKDDSKQVFLGTDNGIFYTADITSGNWSNVNNNQLPNVQIFDIKQQTMAGSDCYNSGQIYVATNGRGIWTNDKYIAYNYVGINEYAVSTSKANNLNLYPNPTNGLINVAFTGIDGESASVQIMDISGRVLKTEELNNVTTGDNTHSFDASELGAGVYIVNVKSNSNVKRVAKLIIAK